MSPEEHYVRNATRGLRGQTRKATQAELLDHLTERTRQLTLTGLSPEQAREQALQELGPAPTVARSLRSGQHVHPALSAAALLALATMLLWPVPELLSEPWRLSLNETSTSVSTLKNEGYMTTTDVTRKLMNYGVTFRRNGSVWVLSHPGWPDATLGWNDLGCTIPQVSSSHDQPHLWFTKIPTAAYIHPSQILTCMSAAEWPITVTPAGVELDGTPIPASWHATRPANLHAHQFAQAVRGLPPANWAASFTTGGPLIWESPIRANETTHKIMVETSARRVALLLRGSTVVRFWPPEDPVNNPMFIYTPLTVQSGHTVTLPDQLSSPGQSRGSFSLLNDLTSWLNAPLSSRPAILVALPDRTDAPVDLTPLKFTP
ncbi:permease prefix domain 1-containing protein [Deinococcus sp. JMULE3]|uniref:permease prefix domain 1-containing protein n=1 Tax=Deinococcus sp. JMULE3 TaxID=2518341 RepID=UPI001575F824|nr:permease prefix domain 1-containing protein [Deinococcus sp. JMULE3]NTY01689.1 hypothetical protein [Deinococcus sp. JMULE3]